MAIGFKEVVFIIFLLLVVILISRFQTKRICPSCGFSLRSYTPSCPECGLVFPKRKRETQGDGK